MTGAAGPQRPSGGLARALFSPDVTAFGVLRGQKGFVEPWGRKTGARLKARRSGGEERAAARSCYCNGLSRRLLGAVRHFVTS